MSIAPEIAKKVFVTGLKNAHGVEHQALALIDRQLDRIEHYPKIAAQLRKHRGETEAQIVRLDDILATFDEKGSVIKDTGLTISGNMAALAHTIAGDEIIKNSFANFAFESFEIASYKGLLTIADVGGFSASNSLLQASLGEEQAMAQWLDDHLAETTTMFLELLSAGEKADR